MDHHQQPVCKDSGPANPARSGRFSTRPHAMMQIIDHSLTFDRRLYEEDIDVSLAHASMLGSCGLISADDVRSIEQGLQCIRNEIREGSFPFRDDLADIHMNIEARLTEIIGPPAERLHTARSRNDQVATDMRLWTKRHIKIIDKALQALQAALLDQAETHYATAMPGTTHGQPAQPITFGHHLLAYVESLGRDRGRMTDCSSRLDECPLGAAALAGTSWPIDRYQTAQALGFKQPMANAMDAVAARDFVLEFLAAASITAVNLSRLAEEIILWTSEPYHFIQLSDAFTTGSSIMPQKRNPDAAELVRAKAGRIVGSLCGLLMVVKALPLAYAKDLQEDKEPLFDAADTLELCLAAMRGMITDMSVSTAAMRSALERAEQHSYLTATDLADWLARQAGLTFREAHDRVGRITRLAAELGVGLADIPPDEITMHMPDQPHCDLKSLLDLDRVIASRTSLGGTAAKEVKRSITQARNRWL